MTKSPDLSKDSASATTKTPVLEMTDVVIHYGRIQALHGISLMSTRASW